MQSGQVIQRLCHFRLVRCGVGVRQLATDVQRFLVSRLGFLDSLGSAVEDRQVVQRNGDLSEGKPGLLGAVTSRAESQTMRLACLYALLDCSAVVRGEHLAAALATWKYCEDSARFIFGDALGDATADEILRTLRSRPEGMTRNGIREHFGRNKLSAEINRALALLQEYGLARVERDQGEQGRPAEHWYAIQ